MNQSGIKNQSRLGLISVFFLILFLNSTQSFAFTCYFTLVKDSCWTNYDVTVSVLDARANKELVKLTVPKGTQWLRQAFDCEAGMTLMHKATFEPSFWESEKGRVYSSLNFLTLPDTVPKATAAWDLPICFPEKFSSVPLPPDAIGHCQCNMNAVPPVPVQ